MPSSRAEWLAIAEEFEMKCGFPHCLGALDGKHCELKAPVNSGSEFWNYKQYYSIVLLALVDASKRFIFIDVGTSGRISDGGILNDSSLLYAIESKQLDIPPASPVHDSSSEIGPLPYVIVADDAFALKEYLMKPFPQRGLTDKSFTFNNSLSKARYCVENAFGILSQRFRVFRSAMQFEPPRAQVVVTAACCLHNFIMKDKGRAQAYTEGETRCVLRRLEHQGSNNYTKRAHNVRMQYVNYFWERRQRRVNGCQGAALQELDIEGQGIEESPQEGPSSRTFGDGPSSYYDVVAFEEVNQEVATGERTSTELQVGISTEVPLQDHNDQDRGKGTKGPGAKNKAKRNS